MTILDIAHRNGSTAMVTKAYVLKWRGGTKSDKGKPSDATRIWFTGPFSSDSRACAWAEKDQKNDGDDPRWQSVRLPENMTGFSNYALPVTAP